MYEYKVWGLCSEPVEVNVWNVFSVDVSPKITRATDLILGGTREERWGHLISTSFSGVIALLDNMSKQTLSL